MGPRWAASSPLWDARSAQCLLPALLLLHASYHALARTRFAASPRVSPQQSLRARSWILTTLGAAGMTLASLPYLWDIVRLGFDFGRIRARTDELALPAAWFFIAYLLSYVRLAAPSLLLLAVAPLVY